MYVYVYTREYLSSSQLIRQINKFPQKFSPVRGWSLSNLFFPFFLSLHPFSQVRRWRLRKTSFFPPFFSSACIPSQKSAYCLNWLCKMTMGWLRAVGSMKLQVSFAEYRLLYRALLQKRPIIQSILLTKATPFPS